MKGPRRSAAITYLALAAAALASGCAGGGGDEGCEPASGVMCTLVGTGVAGLSADGLSPLETELYLPQDTTMGPDGRLYVIDWNNHRVRVLAGDLIETVVGTGELGDAPDGPARRSSFNHPTHVAFEADGDMIVSAWHNSKVMRYDPDTDTVEAICGTGARDFNGDGLGGLETFLDLPVASVVTEDGSILISDQANQRIRRLTPDGIVTTVVGTGEQGYAGDGGPAEEAQIHLPVSQSAPPAGRIALDSEGNLYMADTLNHVVRRVDADRMIDTIAGTGSAGNGNDPDPLASALDMPSDVAIGPEGGLYIADTMNSCVRRLSADGALSTVAGRCGEPGFAGDGGPATDALLDRPYGVEVADDGTLYIADTHNHRIRAVYP